MYGSYVPNVGAIKRALNEIIIGDIKAKHEEKYIGGTKKWTLYPIFLIATIAPDVDTAPIKAAQHPIISFLAFS